eukprot:6357754-Lingulodinium_polyedra.AAC.1
MRTGFGLDRRFVAYAMPLRFSSSMAKCASEMLMMLLGGPWCSGLRPCFGQREGTPLEAVLGAEDALGI